MNVRRPQPHAVATRKAFTLIELLIVIGIIGAVVALGVPLFGVLTGAKSQEAGQNLVAAAIGQARTIALSEGKYAGVLFYIDPATERTAMTVVTVQDPASGLEDPDPYDKYKRWTPGQQYFTSAIEADGTPVRGDRAIGLTSDGTATFRNNPPAKNVYSAGTSYSALSQFFGNFKPTVLVYRARRNSNGPDANGTRPPRNGPFGTATTIYRRIPNAAVDTLSSALESDSGTFQNDNWSTDTVGAIAPSSASGGGERQLLPLGVGVQVILTPVSTTFGAATMTERYARVALVMFDPQGKLSVESRTLPSAGPLGAQLGLTADVPSVPAGVGVVFYDRATFRQNQAHTEADALYQPNAINPSNALTGNPIYADWSTPVNETNEEVWLDQNTVPLLINRYSGALSEAQ